MPIITDSVAADWLTLTSYDAKTARRIEMQLLQIGGTDGSKKASRLQYKGWAAEGVFFGTAKQGELGHYMCVASATAANELLQRMQALGIESGYSCTRIDLQYTKKRENHITSLSICGEELRRYIAQEVKNSSIRPQIKVISSDKRCDETVYIGSRESERFVRIYDKMIDNEEYVRFETEYKGKYANEVMKKCIASDKQAAQILASEVLKYVSASSVTRWLAYSVQSSSSEAIVVHRDMSSDIKKLRWLEDSIIPIMLKLGLGAYKQEIVYMLKSALAQLGE